MDFIKNIFIWRWPISREALYVINDFIMIDYAFSFVYFLECVCQLIATRRGFARPPFVGEQAEFDFKVILD